MSRLIAIPAEITTLSRRKTAAFKLDAAFLKKKKKKKKNTVCYDVALFIIAE